MTENNSKTAHLTPYQWKPGDPSPNPGGRPKGLASFIREKTNDGQDLVTILLSVAKGDEKAFCKWTDRLKAVEMLLDRGGWPKSPVMADPNAIPLPVLDISKMTTEEIHAVEQFGLVLASIRQRLTGGEAEAQP